jgi:glutamate dehydrogenase/leucine dehydrogenase
LGRRRRAQGKRVVVSGSGNVAVYTVEKLLELGAVPLTMSDSKGYVYEPEGFTSDSLAALSEHKVTKRIPLTEYKPKNGAAARPLASDICYLSIRNISPVHCLVSCACWHPDQVWQAAA